MLTFNKNCFILNETSQIEFNENNKLTQVKKY